MDTNFKNIFYIVFYKDYYENGELESEENSMIFFMIEMMTVTPLFNHFKPLLNRREGKIYVLSMRNHRNKSD